MDVVSNISFQQNGQHWVCLIKVGLGGPSIDFNHVRHVSQWEPAHYASASGQRLAEGAPSFIS